MGSDATQPRYLSAAKWGGMVARAFYPTLSASSDDAVRVRLFAENALDEGQVVNNMAKVRIASTESTLNRCNVLSVAWNSRYAYYQTPSNAEGQRWQVRILSSRDSEDSVRAKDEIYFVSQLLPLRGQTWTSVTTPDPLQRLSVSPRDSNYLTSLAGEWSIWKAIRPQGPENV